MKSHGVIPVAYGDGVANRIRAAAPSGVDAFIDTYSDGYVELALALGVAAERIDTIVDFAAAAKYGVKTDGATAAGPGAKVLTNKEIGERLFLSHRTVGTHLYQIFPKLGIASRAALRDALKGLASAVQPTPGSASLDSRFHAGWI